jgi:hypothetical protein
MRDMNLTYLNFKEQYNNQLKKRFSIMLTKDIKILRSAVIDSPTFLRDYEIRLPSSFFLIRALCMFWEFFPENIKWEIFLLLEQKIEKFDFKKQVELKALLDPKTRISFLYLTEKYTSHEIFGNLLQTISLCFHEVKFQKKSTKIKKPQRKRGYNDKGTLRSYDIWSHKWKPSSDWSLTDLQTKQERKHDLRLKYIFKVKKFLENFTTKEERILKSE